MRFWWVNQNQTFEQESRGGYLWSPKRNRNGARNPYYENMRGVTPGDVVFSFRNRTIAAVGVAQSYGYECPKPTEFGTIGANWEMVGWRADVAYTLTHNPVEPRKHMELLRPLMPQRYAPLQPNGNGIQNLYLTEIPRAFAEALAGLIGVEVRELVSTSGDKPALTEPNLAARGIDEWEDRIQDSIKTNKTIPETDRVAIIRARRGQGLFKQNVMRIEKECRITKVDDPAHLMGSHIKPWRDSENNERLDGENGLLLTPSIDHLFDRGFITFKDDGGVVISPVADTLSLKRMGVEAGMSAGSFSRGQRGYLEFHRDEVFLTTARTQT